MFFHDSESMSICSVCMWFEGYGVFARKTFYAGEFLLEYDGKLVDPAFANEQVDQTYFYYFSLSSKLYW